MHGYAGGLGMLDVPRLASASTAVKDLPEILEIKAFLDGRRKEFRCRVVERGPASAVLLFVSSMPYQVADLALPAGTVTFGHFWTDRPYNVYHWLSPQGATVGFYFNIADRTTLDGAELCWRDLVVDLLIAGGGARVLDEAELPATLTPELRAYIEAATRDALAHAPQLTAQLEVAASALWPRAFGAPRP